MSSLFIHFLSILGFVMLFLITVSALADDSIDEIELKADRINQLLIEYDLEPFDRDELIESLQRE